MTVSTTKSEAGPYSTNGSVTDFVFDYVVHDEEHLEVYQENVASGNITLLTLNVDYTVSGVDDASGGHITISPALPSGSNIYINRNVPMLQETSISNQGAWLPKVHENVFDRLTMMIQQIKNNNISLENITDKPVGSLLVKTATGWAVLSSQGDAGTFLRSAGSDSPPDWATPLGGDEWAVEVLHEYQAAKTYGNEEFATYGGKLYVSKQSANTGNTPDSSPLWWEEYGGGGGMAANLLTARNLYGGF